MKLSFGDRNHYFHLAITTGAAAGVAEAVVHLPVDEENVYTIDDAIDIPAGTDLKVFFDQDGEPCTDVIVRSDGPAAVVHAAIESYRNHDTRTFSTNEQVHIGPAYFAPRPDRAQAIRPGTPEYEAFQQFQQGNKGE